ncbi:MAG: mechanosensitive ion channel [Clostridia bacterium]|nr:mechanosensitive ion channel [Clostridia bacterium]
MEWIIEQLKVHGTNIGFRLVAAIIVFAVGFKIVNIIVKKMKKGSGKRFSKIDPSAAGFIASFLSIALKTVIIVSVVAILGVPMSSVVALVASAGVAVGLAVQGALSNFVGGLMILLFKPFSVGDYVEAEGVGGTVRAVTVIYTVLVTPDNKVITLPNGSLTNSIVTNYSTESQRRVDVNVSAGYECDIAKVKALMLDIAKDCDMVLSDPAPMAIVLDYSESAISYSLRVWCENSKYWDVRFYLLDRINSRFKEEGINIPYPQVDVHIKKEQ